MLRITRKEFNRIMGAKRPGKARRVDAAWIARMGRGPGIFVPLRTQTPGNSRRHWSEDAREAKMQRESVASALLLRRQALPKFPVRVKFTRYGPRLTDRHNLPGALKHIIDEVAAFYGVDDGDPRWRFEFAGEVGMGWGVRIEISSAV